MLIVTKISELWYLTSIPPTPSNRVWESMHKNGFIVRKELWTACHFTLGFLGFGLALLGQRHVFGSLLLSCSETTKLTTHHLLYVLNSWLWVLIIGVTSQSKQLLFWKIDKHIITRFTTQSFPDHRCCLAQIPVTHVADLTLPPFGQPLVASAPQAVRLPWFRAYIQYRTFSVKLGELWLLHSLLFLPLVVLLILKQLYTYHISSIFLVNLFLSF